MATRQHSELNWFDKSQLSQIIKKSQHTQYVIMCDIRLLAQLKKCNVPVIGVQVSERTKSFRQIESLALKLLKLGVDRNSCLVAVGGGVVGDLVGFLAASYMRGITWWNVPTTLLAMVDSSFGGKTGVNSGSVKNLLGAFHSPEKIWLSTHWLETLPPREIKSAFGEILKYGLLFDKKLFEELKTSYDNLEDLKPMITKCLDYKAHIVSKDPFEKHGERKLLNLGHTFGHAIEIHAKLKHGEAVLIGLIYAVEMSYHLGHLSKQEYELCVSRLLMFSRKRVKTNTKSTWDLMCKDKKSVKSQPQMVLLKKIAEPIRDIAVTRDDHKRVMQSLVNLNVLAVKV